MLLINRVLNRQDGNNFCQLLASFDVNVNMPMAMYAVKQSVVQRFNDLITK